MVRVAIAGHRGLPRSTSQLVERALIQHVAARADSNLVGLSCLADGPDSMFASAVLECGGKLIAIVPATQYREGLPEEHHATYDALIGRAADVIALDRVESDSQAHMDASLEMLDSSDELLAVWDGQPARGFGGTADVVAAARERGVIVTIVWPAGASRDA